MEISILMISVLSGVFLVLLVKEIYPGYSVFLGVLLGAFILLQILPMIGEVLDHTEKLVSINSEKSLYLLYKAVGSSFLCQYVSDICRDCGMDSMAQKAELFGKIYLTSLCLPLIENILYSVNLI